MNDPELYRHPLFAGCSREHIDAIAALGKWTTHKRGDVVLRYGDPARDVFVLVTGVVRVIIAGPEGERFVAKIFCAPAVFGEMETLSDNTFIETVEVARTSQILSLDRAAANTIFDRYPLVTKNLLIDVCERFRISALHAGFSATHGVEARLANLLLAYCEAFGTQVEGGVQIVFDALTFGEMASGIGSNEKSARRAIKQWTEKGWVQRRGAHLVVCDQPALRECAGPNAPPLSYSLGS